MTEKRSVHLDFHTSQEIKDIGKDFNKEEFKKNLKKANIDSISLFAKCHHGCFYYPSNKFYTHPYLVRSLLDEQVEACKEIGVSSKIYLSVGFDEYLAFEHPEWLWVNEEGNFQTNKFEPVFTLMCLNNGYSDVLKQQTIEVMNRYMPDGIFYDIVVDIPCYCNNCLKDMDKRGIDYKNNTAVKEFATENYNRFCKLMIDTIKNIKPDTMVFFNSGNFPVGEKRFINTCDQLEIESLQQAIGDMTIFR